jgi:hypothetical protein
MTTIEIILAIVAIIVSTGLFSGIFYVGKKIGKYDENSKNLYEKINGFPCSQHDARVSGIKDDITEIKTFLLTKYPSANNVIGIKRSPMALNNYGLKLLKDIAGDDYIRKYLDVLIAKIESKNPVSALDVEQNAYEIMIEMSNDISFKNIKDVIYTYPALQLSNESEEKKYIFTIHDACFALSIPLRDLYLKKHPELIPDNK